MRVVAARPARRCALCHDDLGPVGAAGCGACATRGHEGCLAELGCPTLGCAGRARRVRLPVLLPRGWFDGWDLPFQLFEAAVAIGFSIALGTAVGLGGLCVAAHQHERLWPGEGQAAYHRW